MEGDREPEAVLVLREGEGPSVVEGERASSEEESREWVLLEGEENEVRSEEWTEEDEELHGLS